MTTLKLQLAAVLDMRALVKRTYELEGDRLQLLLVFSRVEGLREVGRSLRNDDTDGVLPNVDAILLRADVKLQNGRKLVNTFPRHGPCVASIMSSRLVDSDSDMYPGQ